MSDQLPRRRNLLPESKRVEPVAPPRRVKDLTPFMMLPLAGGEVLPLASERWAGAQAAFLERKGLAARPKRSRATSRHW